MKKNLLLSSILLGSVLSHTGCVEKDLNQQNNNSPIKSSTPSPLTINSETLNETPIVIKNEHLSNESLSTTQSSQTEENTYYIESIKGKKITVKINKTGFEFPEYRGKIVLLQFFGKKCKHCFHEMPIINKIRNKYGNKLQVIAIQSEEPMTQEEASSIVNTYNIDYPIIEKEQARDLIVFLRDKYEWLGNLPYLLLIKDDFMQSTRNSYEMITENIDSL